MKMSKFAERLLTGIKVVAGVVLQICGFVIWIPARIAMGISEVLSEIGKQLVIVEARDDGSKAKVIEEKTAS